MKQTIQANNATLLLEGKPIMQLGAVEITATLHKREIVLTSEEIERYFPSEVKHK